MSGKGFFFEGYNVATLLVLLAVVLVVILVAEISRRNKWVSIVLYILLPVILGFAIWGRTAIRDSGDWFPLVKTISALVGVIGFMAMRYWKRLENKKWVMLFPALILGINIVEAILREFQIFAKYGSKSVFEAGQQLTMQGGVWNILNSIAGVLLILTMTGWFGIKISKSKSKDMIWPDQLWFWIIAYDFWNLSYCYNAIPERSMYAGLSILLACTIMEFVYKKGAWLQHRAITLAIFAMFSVTFSAYGKSEAFAIKSTLNPKAMILLSVISLVINALVFIFMLYKSIKNRKIPYTNDIYSDLKSYKKVLKDNGLLN